MPKKFIKKYIPSPEKLRGMKSLGVFGELIHSPNLWHLNRRSVSGAFALGLFCAFVPIPFQMLLAAFGALLFRVNLPVSVALVWLTNPITMPPIFYFSYLVGAFILDTPVQHIQFELSWEWLVHELGIIWQPFLLGCFVSGAAAGLLGSFTIRIIWRLAISRSWKRRQLRRLEKAQQNAES